MKITQHIIRRMAVPPLIAVLCAGFSASTLAGAQPSTEGSRSTAKESQSIELKQKWTVGKRYLQRQEMNQETETALPQMPQPMKQTMKQTQDFAISVLAERPGGGRELSFEFVSQKMEMAMRGQTMMSFDSSQDTAADGSNPMAGVMRKLVGAKIKMLADANGKIEKVEGVQELADKLGGDTGGPMQGVFKEMFKEDNLKEMGDMGNCLPDKPVRLGDQWNIQKEINLGPMGTMKLAMTITFKGWEDRDQRRCALLETSGTINSTSDGNLGSMPFKLEDGKTSGKVWFDPELGMSRGGVQVQTMTLKMTSSQGGSVTSKIQQTVTSKFVEATDIKK